MKINFSVSKSQVISEITRKPLKQVVYYYVLEPLTVFIQSSLPEEIAKYLISVILDENALHSGKSANETRELARFRPHVPQIGEIIRQFSQKDTGKDADGNPVSVEVIRARGYFAVPLAMMVFVVSTAVSSFYDRDKLLLLIPDNAPIPQILCEFCRKVRESNSNDISIKMSKVLNIPQWYKDAFKETFMDIEFVRTEKGFLSFISFCQWLSDQEGNYIKMEYFQKATPSKFIPQLNSGSQTTFTAINTISNKEESFAYLTCETQLLPLNSFPGGEVKDVHLHDAQILNGHLSSTENTDSPIGRQLFLSTYEPQMFSSTNVHQYICKRVSGTITNDSGMDDSYPPSSESDSISEPEVKTESKNKNRRPSDSKNLAKRDFTEKSLQLLISLVQQLQQKVKQRETRSSFTSFLKLLSSDAIKGLV